MPVPNDRDDLALSLQDGPFETPLWTTFLDRLRGRTGAGYASLIFRAPGVARPSLVHLFSGEAWPAPLERLYREGLHRDDPVSYHDLAEGRVYAMADLLIPGDPAHDRYQGEVMDPGGVRDFRTMRVVEPGGIPVWLTISRRKGRFGPMDDALVAALAPWLRAALRAHVTLERERFNAAVAGDAIRRLDFGWLTLDAAGLLIETDRHAARLLERCGIATHGPGARLATQGADLDREIADAIRTVTATPPGRPRALVLSRDPWLDMLLVPAHRRRLSAAPAPAAIGYVHGDGWSAADRCEQLAELFELLPSEARLALALGRGASIVEAAGELGLTVETARTYSKRIYAKTGARGQPDLVRFIHRSVLAIA